MDARTIAEITVLAAAIAATLLAYKLGSSRRADRATIAGLQRALTTVFPQIPGLAIGSAVLSASPGLKVGGDIVDVFPIDSRFTMLLVADVSGKGVEAAAHTAFITYAIRTLALENDGDPAVVVAKFNAMYERTVSDDEAFVALILGLIDAQSGAVRYASAGHEAAFVRRRDGGLTLLPPTGPIVGAAAFSAYRSGLVMLDPGDVLVWATDGLAESRDRGRRLLGMDGLAGWITGAPHDAAALADGLIDSLRRRSGSAAEDDVAVLAVAYDPAPAQPPRVALPAYR